MFRNFYIKSGPKATDILRDGRLSCAALVSAVLYLNKFIGDLHANVRSTVADMLKSGWYEIKELKPGAILVWEEKMGKDDGIMHGHIGFYVGNDEAVSNDSLNTGFPHRHHYTYNDSRKIEKIYWHSDLNE